MRNPTQNNPLNVANLLAAIRHKEQSCDRCGRVKLTLPKGRANFCVECIGHFTTTKLSQEVH